MYEDTRTVDEKIAFYTQMDEHLQAEIKKSEHELQTNLKTQHDVRRKLFNLQYEKRNPGK